MAVAGGEYETKGGIHSLWGCDRRSSRHRMGGKRMRGSAVNDKRKEKNRERCLVVKEKGKRSRREGWGRARNDNIREPVNRVWMGQGPTNGQG